MRRKHEAISGQVFLVAFLRCISSAFALDSNNSRGRRGGCERSRDLFAAHLLQSRPSRGESNRGAAANFEAGRVASARRMHHAAGLGPRCGRVAGVAQRPSSCELFLIWKTSSGNLERRFRRFAEVHCPERARLLDTSVEDVSMVDQAPSSKLLRMWLEQQERSEPAVLRPHCSLDRA